MQVPFNKNILICVNLILIIEYLNSNLIFINGTK